MDIKSIVIYLTTFFSSLLFISVAEFFLNFINYKKVIVLHKNKIEYINKKIVSFDNLIALCLFMILSIIGLLIPILLATFRDITVGNDIKVYVLNNFERGKDTINFYEFRKEDLSKTELLFSLILYIGSKLNSLKFIFCIIDILEIVPVYLSLTILYDKISIKYGMLVFYLFFYNFGLSGMRQSIASAFLMLSIVLFYKKKFGLFAFFLIISCLFHNSVIIVALLFIIIFLLIKSRRVFLNLNIFFILLLIFFFTYNHIISFFYPFINIISSRYVFYLNKYLISGINWSNVPLTELVSKTSIVIALFIFFIQSIKNKTKNDLFFLFLLVIVVLGRYFNVFNAVFYEATRIQLHCDYYLILAIPYCYKKVIYYKDNKILFFILSLMCMLLYWLYFIMHIGAYQTNIFAFS